MADIDTYRIPVDFRIGRHPANVEGKNAQANFNDIYDFAFAVISTFVRYCGIGTIDPASWGNLASDPTLTLYSGNVNKLYAKCGQAFNAGQLITLTNVAGVLTAVQAQGNSALGAVARADGFTTAAFNNGDIGEFIIQSGINKYRVGATIIGQRYYLGGSGNFATAPLTAAGNLEQYAGVGVSTTAILVNLGTPVQH